MAGRLDFEALQRRYARRRSAADLAQTEPCHLELFDVLETRRLGDLRRKGLAAQRDPGAGCCNLRLPAPLSLGMQTDDADLARLWCDELPGAGVEGLIIKPADSTNSGRREWLMYKVHRTTDAIVGGVIGSLRRPESLLLGRYGSESGEFHYAGRTTPLTDAAAAAIAPLLAAAGTDHPWPDALVTNWRAAPTPYVRVERTVVVEIRADIATDQNRRWRHAVRYLRVRGIPPKMSRSIWTSRRDRPHFGERVYIEQVFE